MIQGKVNTILIKYKINLKFLYQVYKIVQKNNFKVFETNKRT